ncbi:MAG: nuclear transport factor 2 family protein [Cyanophyceae cyanobacterium]
MRNATSKFSKLKLFCLGLGASLSCSVAVAEPPQTAPEELQQTIAQLEAAANSQDVEAIGGFYSPNFTTAEGMSSSALFQALTQLWERYPDLTYTTELQSWEREGNELVADTVTVIRGTGNSNGRSTRLDSTIRSRQYFRDLKLVRQETLAEQTQLSSGDNPPQVWVNLPEQVQSGEQFNFDVIVDKPLGNDVLLGAATEELTASDRYFDPSTLELDILPAGGIFKLVNAPDEPGDRWLSAVLVRADGMTIVTQRVSIEE